MFTPARPEKTDPGPSVGTGAPGPGPLAGVGSTDLGSTVGVGSTDFGSMGGVASTDFGSTVGVGSTDFGSDELGADASDFGRATSDRGAPMVIRRIVGEVRDPVAAEHVDVETVMLCAGPLSVEVCTLGATWRRFDVPCGETTTNILLGPSRWEDLLGPARQHFMGSTIGPVSGRIAGDKADRRAVGGAYASDAFFPFADGRASNRFRQTAARGTQRGGIVRPPSVDIDAHGHHRIRSDGNVRT